MKRFIIAVMFAVTALVSLLPADGWALSFVSTRGGLTGSNDFVDWSGLAPNFNTVTSPFSTTSNGGLAITGSIPTGNFERLEQGNGWNGNFNPGDAVIWTQDNPGPFSLSFANPIFGVGAQIQNEQFGVFSGLISAFDSSNALLGTFLLTGNSTSLADNSAIFLGVSDTTASISRIEFDTIAGGAAVRDFGINRLDIVTSTNQVPEPASLMLLGAGLAAIGIWRRKATKV